MTEDYAKSLEESVQRQQIIIESLFEDRDTLSKLLKQLTINNEILLTRCENCINAPNPGRKEDEIPLMQALLKKIKSELLIQAHELMRVSKYAESDPSDYRFTRIHSAIPVINKTTS